jgi:TetR/AcrR family transcriptional regulator
MASIPHEFNDSSGSARMRGDERREQLIRVAINLFSHKGFSGTTTKEIAQAAGVTEALIFRHFPTKEALYDAILLWRVENSRMSDGWAKIRDLADRRDDAGLFRTVALGMLDFHRENVDFLRLMFFAKLEGHNLGERFRERHLKEMDTFLREYVATRQREGAFRDVDPDTAVRAIFGMTFLYSLNVNLFNCRTSDLTDEQTVDTFIRIALDGLRRPAEVEAPEEQG